MVDTLHVSILRVCDTGFAILLLLLLFRFFRGHPRHAIRQPRQRIYYCYAYTCPTQTMPIPSTRDVSHHLYYRCLYVQSFRKIRCPLFVEIVSSPSSVFVSGIFSSYRPKRFDTRISLEMMKKEIQVNLPRFCHADTAKERPR